MVEQKDAPAKRGRRSKAETAGAAATAAAATAAASSAASVAIPGLGKTRCYWAVMDSNMTFRYLDPVLQSHMQEQAPLVIGKSLVEFIHPHERQAAAEDFAKFRSSTTIFGSVTRCRYARVSYARKLLGAEQPETDKVSPNLKYLDDQWVALRIVASLVAENTVLVFFHATADVDEAKDMDDVNLSDWTNWCGPRVTDVTRDYLTPEQKEKLNAAFTACQAEAEPIKDNSGGDVSVSDGTTSGGGQLAYVFQLLNSSSGDILYTWPPVVPTGNEKDLTLHGPVEEGQERYVPTDYSNLARAVLDKRRDKVGNEAKTSCTKRFQSRHPISLTDGAIGNIESVVVTYQSIAFVCFQTGNGYLNSKTVNPGPVLANSTKRRAGVDDDLDADDVIKRLKAADANGSGLGNWAATLGNDANGYTGMPPSLENWVADNGDASLNSPYYAGTAYPNVYASMYGQGDGSTSGYMGNAGASIPPLPGSVNASGDDGTNSALTNLAIASSGSYYTDYTGAQYPVASASGDGKVPNLAYIPHHRDIGTDGQTPTTATTSRSNKSVTLDENGQPVPILHKVRKADRNRVCTSCGTSNSPEWRKGPSGIKTLCNACGLRYSRAQSRKNKKAQKEADLAAGITGGSGPDSASGTPTTSYVPAPLSLGATGSAPTTLEGQPPSPYMPLPDYNNPHSAPLPPLPQSAASVVGNGGAAGLGASTSGPNYGSYGSFVNYTPYDNWSPASNQSFASQQNQAQQGGA